MVHVQEPAVNKQTIIPFNSGVADPIGKGRIIKMRPFLFSKKRTKNYDFHSCLKSSGPTTLCPRSLKASIIGEGSSVSTRTTTILRFLW